MNKAPKDIADASAQAALLPASECCKLPGGRQVVVHRLSWLEFEQVWQALSGTLSALLLSEQEVTEERLAEELAAAPRVVSMLVAAATKLELDELSQWAFDDVLAAAATAARFNFADSRGIRDFFCIAQQLAQPDQSGENIGP